MVELERNYDKGLSTPYYYVIFHEVDDLEPIANLTEQNPIPIPERGDTVSLARGDTQEDGGITSEQVGSFEVVDIEYEYSLTQNTHRVTDDMEENSPDVLAIVVDVTVSRVD
ncbi:MAG: hypothetical protein IH933_11190 [Euryarchaeota archaeon]|jgi:hypothetical protein|nr:hypothetical protein [Euryarchaeota archaeon]